MNLTADAGLPGAVGSTKLAVTKLSKRGLCSMQYLPEGTCMSLVTQAQCDHIVDDLNNRARKRLGFNTPADLYHRH